MIPHRLFLLNQRFNLMAEEGVSVKPEYESNLGANEDPNQMMLGIADALRSGENRMGKLGGALPLEAWENILSKKAFKAKPTFGDFQDAQL